MNSDYIELRARSAFSFLEGATTPEDLASRAAELGYGAMALGDRDGLYGAPRFYLAAKAAGIRQIVGAELTLDDDSRLYVLAPDRQRYQNLCRMITDSKMRVLNPGARTRDGSDAAPVYPAKGESRITLDELERYGRGLICLGGGVMSPLSRMLVRGDDPRSLCARLGGIFGAGNFYIDLQRHLDAGEERLNRKLAALASAARIPIVATNDVCHGGSDRKLLDVLTCIRLKTTLEEAGRALWINSERHLKPPAEMAALFRDLPGAVNASRAIAERCAFQLCDMGYRFPDYPLPPGEKPDSDLDLPSGDDREQAIQYVYRRYGERGAAMTANVITYRTRSAVREVGKTLGFSPDQVDRLAKLNQVYEFRDHHDDLVALLKRGGVDAEAPRIMMMVELVRKIQSLPRHLGQHSGGMVIAAQPLDEIVPLEPASMPGRVVIQWDKDDCADLGIIKIDLLGLGMLAALKEAIPMIRKHEGIEIDLAHLPQDDPDVYAMLRRADTVGVFQIESRAQMATLPRMKPERFYDLVVEVAIIRPGPIVGKMVHPYLDRRNKRAPVEYPHPSLEPILKRTLGVPLFQEQLLRMAMTVAGFSGGEAEELRRAMGFKRSAERMEKIEARLRAGMLRNGLQGTLADDIVRSITSFALYGFPESHAASFALIAYASAYLKHHHPAAFLAAMLNCYPLGFYHPSTLVKDTARHGVTVLPIDVTRSDWKCTIETVDGRPATRMGLRYVTGLREEIGLRIESERARRQFDSIADLTARVGPNRREIDALAYAGTFGAFGFARRDAMWNVAAVERDPTSLLAGAKPRDGEVPLASMSPIDETLADYAATGLTTGPHLMTYLRADLNARGILSADALTRAKHQSWVKTAGVVIVRQRPGTAKGFLFITLEDESGISNLIVTPDLFQKNRLLLRSAGILLAEGVLQRIDGVTAIRARRFEEIKIPGTIPPSHDFH